MIKRQENKLKSVEHQLKILKSGPMGSADVFDRNSLTEQLENSLSLKRHLIVFGPAGQGKTSLLREVIKDKKNLVIDCRSSVARKDIYRIILSRSGYSVRLERKSSGKIGGKASVKFFGVGVDGDTSGEIENKYQDLQADLTKGTEVCALLNGSKPPSYVILNNFDFLSSGTQEAIASELGIFDEQSELRFIVVGRWIDRYYIEKLSPELSGRLEKLEVNRWSSDDLIMFIDKCSEISGAQQMDRTCLKYVTQVSNGDIGIFNRLARIYYESTDSENINITKFKKVVKKYLVDRYLDINFRRILDFLFLKDLLISFSVTRDVLKRTNEIIVADDMDDLEKKANALGIEIDHDNVAELITGKICLRYEKEELDKERTDYGVYIGYWLFRKFLLDEDTNSEVRVKVDELVSDFLSEFARGANEVDERKLKNCIQSVGRSQLRNGISPDIFELDSTKKHIFITDNQLLAYFKYADKEDFENDLDEYIDGINLIKKPKRKNDICKNFYTRSIDRVLLEPMALDDASKPVDPDD